MKRHGHGRGKCPGGRCPDDGVDLSACEGGVQRLRWGSEPIAHKDRGADMHLVLDFSLGECRSVMDAPVNRLEAAIDEAFLEKSVKRLERPGFVIARHRLIRVI